SSAAMGGGSDRVFVESHGVGRCVAQALAEADERRWYTPPGGVVAGPANSWYLADTTRVDKLAGDNPPSPTPNTPVYVVPPDPGTGPVLASPSPCPSPLPNPKPPGC